MYISDVQEDDLEIAIKVSGNWRVNVQGGKVFFAIAEFFGLLPIRLISDNLLPQVRGISLL